MIKKLALLSSTLLALCACAAPAQNQAGVADELTNDLETSVGTYSLIGKGNWAHYVPEFPDMDLVLRKNKTYTLTFEDKSYEGTFGLTRIKNEDSVVTYDGYYPSEDVCHIYRFSLSRPDGDIPYPVDECFTAASASKGQFLYCFVDGVHPTYKSSHVIHRKGFYGARFDSEGNIIPDLEVVFVKQH